MQRTDRFAAALSSAKVSEVVVGSAERPGRKRRAERRMLADARATTLSLSTARRGDIHRHVPLTLAHADARALPSPPLGERGRERNVREPMSSATIWMAREWGEI